MLRPALRPAALLAALAGCLVIAACATTPQQAVDRENLLLAAGFTALPANTPERVTSLRRLPANRVVQRRRGGLVAYVYADPLVCGCLYVGDVAAFGRYRQEVVQRRWAEERAFAGPIDQGGWEEGPWGPAE